jgi:hypothetical protein
VETAGHGDDLEAACGWGLGGVHGQRQAPEMVGVPAGTAVGGDGDLATGRGQALGATEFVTQNWVDGVLQETIGIGAQESVGSERNFPSI